MMEDEVVRRRRWLSQEEFLDLLGATNLIPGPNSTELAIHIGHRRAGWPGLVIAGSCFILPAAIMVGAIAWAYVQYGSLPQASALLYGVKPVIIAIIAQALWRLGHTALKTIWLAIVGVIGVVLTLFGVNELAVLFAAGAVVSLSRWLASLKGKHRTLFSFAPAPMTLLTQAAGAAATSATSFGLLPLFLFFLKVGSVLFGSGYVLLAFLRADLVERWHWMTDGQLLDAIAVGQITPGPVFTTATFIGYVLGGSKGAVVATAGIFLPAFVFVALSGPLVPRIRKSKVAGAFLDGVNAASMSLMAVVTYWLARSTLVDVVTVGLAAVRLILLVRFKLNSAWLVLAGAVAGLLSFLWR
jgi:chromate transporter